MRRKTRSRISDARPSNSACSGQAAASRLLRGDEQEPDTRCGTSGTSGHVTAKSSVHNMKRMADRGFTEIDLRRMIESASGYRRGIEPGRWVIVARHRRQHWEVIVEPDIDAKMLLVITAYGLRGK